MIVDVEAEVVAAAAMSLAAVVQAAGETKIDSVMV